MGPSAAKSYLGLTGAEKRCFWRAFGTLGKVQAVLWLAGYQRAMRFMKPARHESRAVGRKIPEELAAAVNRASRLYPGMKCLARSIALHHLLEKAGYDPVLRIGVVHQEQNFGAHAWVELDGEPLGEADDVGKRFKADWS